MKANVVDNRISSLVGWRFPMMVTIILSHFFLIKDGYATFFDVHLYNADIAVSFFFIMSGFGLTYSTIIKRDSRTEEKYSLLSGLCYAYKRVNKLYFWYLIGLILSVPIVYNISAGGVRLVAKIGICATLLQSLSGMTGISHLLNAPCWFLSTLFCLYAIYPLLKKVNNRIILSSKNKNVAFKLLFLVFLIRMPVYVLFIHLHNTTPFTDLFYGSPYIRIFDFVLGILLCDVFVSVKIKLSRSVWTLIELVTTLVFLFWWFEAGVIQSSATSVISVSISIFVALSLIFVFAHDSGMISQCMSLDSMLWLGNISMYLFIFHYPLIFLTANLSKHLFDNSPWIVVSNVILTMLLSFMMSLLAKRYPNPFNKR